jgi:RNA polymerase sigma-70 factor (ECF subfamily)
MANLQRDLVKRAADGDQDAFESLVRLSAGRLFAIAYRVLRDHDHAEDALQQTLATIWNELPRLRDPDRFEAWSYRLIVRASVAQARRERRGQPVVHLLPNDADTIATPVPDEFDRIADRDQLERGFRRLTPDQRAVPFSSTTSACRSPRSPTSSASRSARPAPASITRPVRFEPPSMRTIGSEASRSGRHERQRPRPSTQRLAGGWADQRTGTVDRRRARSRPCAPPPA